MHSDQRRFLKRPKPQKVERQVAREISYSHSASSKGGRALIRVMENTTGRIGLIRKARGYEQEVAAGRDFWEVMTERYRIGLKVTKGSLSNIPAEGPLVLVANHPYGILDGLILGRILSERRQGDFKVLAHQIFRKAPDLERIILPISFDESKEAAKLNVRTRAEALQYLKDGGAIGIFPGGTVSTGAKLFSPALDPSWRTFTAKMVCKSNATVVPVYFEGSNSRLFQIASHLHSTLRMGLLIREFKTRVGTDVGIAVGEPIPEDVLAPYRSDPTGMMDLLRRATYELSPDPTAADRRGHEFEDQWKGRKNGSGNL